jgi:hypothetical protein
MLGPEWVLGSCEVFKFIASVYSHLSTHQRTPRRAHDICTQCSTLDGCPSASPTRPKGVPMLCQTETEQCPDPPDPHRSPPSWHHCHRLRSIWYPSCSHTSHTSSYSRIFLNCSLLLPPKPSVRG